MKQAEEMGVILKAQIEGIQTHAEELLAQKDMECQQELQQTKAECQMLLEEQSVEAEKRMPNDAKDSRFGSRVRCAE